METGALMGRVDFQLLELLSINTCIDTYASAGRTHGSKCTETNLSKTLLCRQQAMEPPPIFQSLPFNMLWNFDKIIIFMDKHFVSIPTVSI